MSPKLSAAQSAYVRKKADDILIDIVESSGLLSLVYLISRLPYPSSQSGNGNTQQLPAVDLHFSFWPKCTGTLSLQICAPYIYTLYKCFLSEIQYNGMLLMMRFFPWHEAFRDCFD